MKVSNTSLIFYSHSSYSDLWEVFTSSVEEFCDIEFTEYYFLTDHGECTPKYKKVIYENEQEYSKRILNALNQVKTEFVIVHHEDMFFQDKVNNDMFSNSIDKLKEYEEISFIKYLKAGTPSDINRLSRYKEERDFYLIKSNFDYVFTVQPNLWRVEDLKKILEEFNLNGWQMETDTQQYCRRKNLQGLCYFTGKENKRGMFHWDSIVYPTVNAISKGKWITSEYGEDIARIAKKHSIDLSIRGEI